VVVEAKAAAASPDDPAGRFDTPYHRLARLPRPLWLHALISAVGSRVERLDHAHDWLHCLLEGRLPEPSCDFGDADATSELRQVAGELGLQGLSQGLQSLAEQVVRTLLWHLDRLVDLQPRLSRAEALAQISQEFRAAWKLQTSGLEPELVLLRELADGAHLQWDALRGQLRSREWSAARRAADRLHAVPEIAALIQRLGRSEPRPLAPRAAPKRPDDPTPAPLRAVTTRIPNAPGELTGIRFSASIERMLAGEAVLLHHPLGRRLWRARHAEGRLLAHDSEAVLTDWHTDPLAERRSASAQLATDPSERGPIVLCLDTSGSMRGAPEQVAKAVTIAALRVAHSERRGCKLIAFGGPGELLERDLHGSGGLQALLELMGQAFDGGTDVQTPIETAIDRVHEAAWASADLLIVSDGEFGCVPQTLTRLDQARRELGLRVQGVLVGDRETMGMLDVCDAIHWVRDWRRHADEAGAERSRANAPPTFSPVHSKSLTALYFPNALSERAARHQRNAPSSAAASGGLVPPAAR
jgi:uncharacterized protein with von Willebrand factor type A (vWA) domain